MEIEAEKILVQYERKRDALLCNDRMTNEDIQVSTAEMFQSVIKTSFPKDILQIRKRSIT